MENTRDILAGNNSILNETIGLQVLDPKRRRLEEPKEIGPEENNITDDTNMIDEDTLANSRKTYDYFLV